MAAIGRNASVPDGPAASPRPTSSTGQSRHGTKADEPEEQEAEDEDYADIAQPRLLLKQRTAPVRLESSSSEGGEAFPKCISQPTSPRDLRSRFASTDSEGSDVDGASRRVLSKSLGDRKDSANRPGVTDFSGGRKSSSFYRATSKLLASGSFQKILDEDRSSSTSESKTVRFDQLRRASTMTGSSTETSPLVRPAAEMKLMATFEAISGSEDKEEEFSRRRSAVLSASEVLKALMTEPKGKDGASASGSPKANWAGNVGGHHQKKDARAHYTIDAKEKPKTSFTAMQNARFIQHVIRDIGDDASKCFDRCTKRLDRQARAHDVYGKDVPNVEVNVQQEVRKMAAKLRLQRRNEIWSGLLTAAAERAHVLADARTRNTGDCSPVGSDGDSDPQEEDGNDMSMAGDMSYHDMSGEFDFGDLPSSDDAGRRGTNRRGSVEGKRTQQGRVNARGTRAGRKSSTASEPDSPTASAVAGVATATSTLRRGANRRLPEIARLRSRFHDQAKILSGNWKRAVGTEKRYREQVARQLGLEDADWLRESAYKVTVPDLERIADEKTWRLQNEAATRIQLFWRGIEARKIFWQKVIARRHALLKVQAKIKNCLTYRWPLARHCEKRFQQVRAAKRIQAVVRGWLARLHTADALELHTVSWRMQILTAELRQKITPCVKRLQTWLRARIARRKIQNLIDARKAVLEAKAAEAKAKSAERAAQGNKCNLGVPNEGRRGTLFRQRRVSVCGEMDSQYTLPASLIEAYENGTLVSTDVLLAHLPASAIVGGRGRVPSFQEEEAAAKKKPPATFEDQYTQLGHIRALGPQLKGDVLTSDVGRMGGLRPAFATGGLNELAPTAVAPTTATPPARAPLAPMPPASPRPKAPKLPKAPRPKAQRARPRPRLPQIPGAAGAAGADGEGLAGLTQGSAAGPAAQTMRSTSAQESPGMVDASESSPRFRVVVHRSSITSRDRTRMRRLSN
eukprot:TRINITY_DN9906_c1_g1_i2.p1 TRINITY_DN9906_c1_g1~~TRINITY_DN9906_c1_g1_i2.p1  ORF type:complete len:969 (-),score=216.69 TRINITY_DN9906_c1_g1_i2:439-3345(-)